MGTSVAQLLHFLAQENQTQLDIQHEYECIMGFLETLTDKTVCELNSNGLAVKIAEAISRKRLCNLQWTAGCPSRNHICALLRVCRVLFRDRLCIDIFHSIGEHSNFIQFANYLSRNFLNYETEYTQAASLLLNVTQKLLHNAETAAAFVRAQIAKCMLRFLSCREMSIQQAALEILGRAADWSAVCRIELCASTAVDVCLQFIPQGDLLTQKLCVSLLRILASEEQAREQIRIYDGVPLLVGLLSVRNSRLQWHVAWCLAQLAEDPETSSEIANVGGVPLVFAEFVDMKPPAKALNDWIAMVTGLCALLAQLCQCDWNQYHVVNNNGVYLLGKALLLGAEDQRLLDNQGWRSTQSSIFRVLRILFSLERNRGLFRKVFPTAFLEQFIDVGHYVHELSVYRPLADEYSKIIANTPLADLHRTWESVNQKRDPIGRVAEYDLIEQLGAGAFGCVYTARKSGTVTNNGTPQYFALKEIYMMQLNVEDDKSIGDVINEVKIIKQQLRHPNIVRYRRVFVENYRLYILMDLIEGASLNEHITSLKEKRQSFSEDRIWNIVIQMVLALRYLHKDKQIVHRDIKPSNIMIAENDRVVITDFGLAKKRGSEYLKSATGTIIYSCPEIVQNMSYGEKADVWSFGCCVYEMTELRPPFYSQNVLALATQIVEGKYEPVSPDRSKELSELISSCLVVSPICRPDILEVARIAASRMLLCLDDIFRMHVSKSMEANLCSNKQKKDATSLESSSRSSKGVLTRRKPGPHSELPKNVLPFIDNSIDKPRTVHQDVNEFISANVSALTPSSGSGKSTCISPSNPYLPVMQVEIYELVLRVLCRKSLDQDLGRRVTIAEAEHRRANSSGPVETRKSHEGLAIRSASLRPVNDPLLEILSQIHRIILICDLGPLETINHRRRVVEQFRRRLFNKSSNAEMIKKHLRKLSTEAHEHIDMDLGYANFRPVLADIHMLDYQNDQRITHLTYEQLSACIQQLIKENF